MKETTLGEAIKSLTFLVNFFTTLGYDPKAEKKLGSWVNEIGSRGQEFTSMVESILIYLEDIQEGLIEALGEEMKILEEEQQALLGQIKSLRDEMAMEKRANSKKAMKGATHVKCGICSSRTCGWDGRPLSAHTHPAKPSKARK